MHTVAGLPVKSTWIKAIKHGNFETWSGLTYTNAAKYCPRAVETIKVHMVQSSQGVISTKKTKYQSRENKKYPRPGHTRKTIRRRRYPTTFQNKITPHMGSTHK